MTGDDERPDIVPPRVRTGVAIAITVLWSVSVVSSIVAVWFGRDFTFNPWVGLTMLGSSAGIFGSNFLRGIDRR